MGLHGRLRHQRAAEVRLHPAGRGAHGRDRGGDAAGPPQRPGPRAGAAHPRRLDRLLGDLAAPRPARPRAALDAGARADRDAPPHPRADRGPGRGDRDHPAPVHRGQAALRPGPRRRMGGPRHRRGPRPPVRPEPGVRRARERLVTTWSLVTVVADGEPFVAARLGDGSLREVPALKQWSSLAELVDDWPAAAEAVRAIDVEAADPLAGVRLLAPLRYPRKVICAGVNYRRHVAEMGIEPPTADWTPFFFLKPPTTAVIGPFDDVPVDGPEAALLDWEAELAAVVGVGGRDVPPERALAHVAGYCVSNDITARGYHRRASAPAPPFDYDWFASKARDGSLPLGPGLTPAWFVPDPQDLRNRLVLKADNALPFVSAMTRCDIVERYGPTVFDRDIEFRGQRFRERITLEEPHRVVFTRISGPVLGTIANEIEGPDDDLRLRFSFALVVAGVEGGSQAEREYADGMTADYLKAVAATLDAMRRIARGEAA